MLDTYRAVKALTAVGFTETQAQTLIETVGEGRGNLATKEDVHETALATKNELRAEIADVRTELKADIADVRAELKTDIADLQTELKSDIAAMHTEFQALELRIERRLTGLVLQLAVLQVMVGGLIVAALKLLP